jgi:hypothetical protein
MEVELLLLNNIKVANHDTSNWPHQARIPAQKRQQASSILDDVPRCGYNTEDRDEHCTAEDIDVFGRETGDII